MTHIRKCIIQDQIYYSCAYYYSWRQAKIKSVDAVRRTPTLGAEQTPKTVVKTALVL